MPTGVYSSYINSLTYTKSVKESLKQGLINKGIEAASNASFDKFPELFSENFRIIKKEPSFVRPAGWLTMPVITDVEQKVAILNPVYDHESNYAAVTVADNYTVDWGDGSIINYNSGIKAEHQYNYATCNNWCTEGYKQVMIIITPQAAQNLTSVTLNVKHSISTTKENGFLEVTGAGSLINFLKVNALPNLKIFSFGLRSFFFIYV